jgi:hypothetical protein
MCEGDDVLLTDDNGVIGTDSSLGVSDFLAVIGGGDAAPLVQSGTAAQSQSATASQSQWAVVAILMLTSYAWAMPTSSLGTGDVLAAIGGGSIGAICDSGSVAIGGNSNLVDALRMGSDDNILSTGDLSMNDQCSRGDSDALAVGKGSDILRANDGVVLVMGGDILGMCSGSGPDHVAIHDLPTLRAFTIAAPPLCVHKEWSFTLLSGCYSTFDLTHNQRSKMLLSLSESRWGHR